MAAVLVFVIAFGAFAWTASPVVAWLDSAEFVAASATLGIAHPPGEPLTTLLGRAATLVPIGDVALRVNLTSAAAVALASAGMTVAAQRLLQLVAPSLAARARAVIAGAAALGFAASYSAWFQAVRAEVYGLEAALLLAALAWVLGWEARAATARHDHRPLYAAGLACGLALATHHFVTLLFLVPTGVAILTARRAGVKPLARVALLGVLGLAAFLYLPVRAAREPMVDWGAPDRAGRFAWTVSARAFQKSLVRPDDDDAAAAAAPRRSRAADLVLVAGTLVEQASPAATVAALAGAYLLLRRRRSRRAGLLVVGVMACVGAGPALIGFDPQNPDAHGYLLAALGALLLLAAAGASAVADLVAELAPGARRGVAFAAALLAATLPVTQAAAHAREASLRDARAAEAWGRAVLDVPPRTLLLSAYYETTFLLWYLQAVEGLRPDVAILDRSLLTYPGEAAHARARHPELAPLIDAPLRAGRESPIPTLAALAARRPVAFELHLNLDDAVLPHLAPRGSLAWFASRALDAGTRTALEAADVAATDQLAASLATDAPRDRVGAERILLWNAYVRARIYCAQDRKAASRAAVRFADALAPGDPTLGALAARCGLTGR